MANDEPSGLIFDWHRRNLVSLAFVSFENSERRIEFRTTDFTPVFAFDLIVDDQVSAFIRCVELGELNVNRVIVREGVTCKKTDADQKDGQADKESGGVGIACHKNSMNHFSAVHEKGRGQVRFIHHNIHDTTKIVPSGTVALSFHKRFEPAMIRDMHVIWIWAVLILSGCFDIPNRPGGSETSSFDASRNQTDDTSEQADVRLSSDLAIEPDMRADGPCESECGAGQCAEGLCRGT